MRRLGLYGGSFDPVHLGHLLVSQAAHEELELEKIFFIPAAQSPFKPDRTLAPAEVRTKMLRLALAGRPECEIDTQELERGGISYSIDTILDFRGRFPQAQLFYLIGADHVSELPRWRDAAQLARIVTFVVIPRPSQTNEATPAGFNFVYLKGFPLGLSSSQIRDRVRSGLPLHHLVGPAVAEVILHNRLYL